MEDLRARNTEAASIPWNCLRKVDTYPNINALWIEYSKEGRSVKIKSGSKSSNVYQFSVLSEKAGNFYQTRKKHIIDQVQSGAYRGSIEDVESWPIGCHGKNWDQPCTSQQVTAAAAELFKSIGLSEEDLAYLELEMEYFENRHYKTIELTAYVFRRACATRYYHLGMDTDETLYLMGHSFGSKEKRNELSNPDRLKKMYDKIIMHPIVGDLNMNDMTIVMEGSHLDVVLLRDQDVVIPCRGQNIEIVYIPYENAADGSIILKVIDDNGDYVSIPFSFNYKKSELCSNPKLYLRSEYLDLYREGFEAYQKLMEKAVDQ